MKLLKELDFIHNKKVNLTLNITAVLLIFPFLALFTWIAILMYGKGSEVFHFFDLFYLLVLMVIHELIHGFFFKVLGDENTKVKFGLRVAWPMRPAQAVVTVGKGCSSLSWHLSF